MDQWTEPTWPERVDPPTLRAVAGHAVRVLRRPEVLPSAYNPAYDAAYEFGGYPRRSAGRRPRDHRDPDPGGR